MTQILSLPEVGRKVPAEQFTENNCRGVPRAWLLPLPGAEDTTPERIYELSKRLVAAGLSVIPVNAYYGDKSPDPGRLPRCLQSFAGNCGRYPSWSAFQIRRPTDQELLSWCNAGGDYGLAVVAGTVSGRADGLGLEIIDFDTKELFEPWKNRVERCAPGLVERLVRVATPRPGLHVYYRCSVYGVSQKLASEPSVDSYGNSVLDGGGRPVPHGLIETKGEGGYCLIPGCPARCHPSTRLYQYESGSGELTTIPTIAPDERLVLLEEARKFNRWHDGRPARPSKRRSGGASGRLPGDDFNARATWEDVLVPHGWVPTQSYGEEGRWCRPGKPCGTSATTNHGGSDLLHVFSSSASPLEMGKSYSKFTAYAVLNHDGDFTRAAKRLSEQGYGRRKLSKGKRRPTIESFTE